MAAAGLVPQTIVLALGAVALGFPDALRLLLELAGRSPLLDIAACVLAIAVATAHVLGAMLLSRFIRKPRPGAAAGGPARPADGFAKLALALSLGVAFFVFLCLLVAPGAGAGGLGQVYLVVDFAGQGPTITAVLVVGGAAALLRAIGGAAPARGTGSRHLGMLARRQCSSLALVSMALACLAVTMTRVPRRSSACAA